MQGRERPADAMLIITIAAAIAYVIPCAGSLLWGVTLPGIIGCTPGIRAWPTGESKVLGVRGPLRPAAPGSPFSVSAVVRNPCPSAFLCGSQSVGEGVHGTPYVTWVIAYRASLDLHLLLRVRWGQEPEDGGRRTDDSQRRRGFIVAFVRRTPVEYGCGGRNPPRETTCCIEISDASTQTVRFVSVKRLEGSVLFAFGQGAPELLCLWRSASLIRPPT